MNYAVLKGLLKEKGKTYQDCAAAIGIDYSTFCGKINGTREWRLDEVRNLWKFLQMPVYSIVFYFFDNEVGESEQDNKE